MNNCYIGLNGDYRECHKLSYSRKKGFKDVNNFAAEELEILFLQANIPFSSNLSSVQNLICYHHYANLISKFESKQKYYCDPFNVHKTVKVFGRKAISLDVAKQLTISTNKKSSLVTNFVHAVKVSRAKIQNQ